MRFLDINKNGIDNTDDLLDFDIPDDENNGAASNNTESTINVKPGPKAVRPNTANRNNTGRRKPLIDTSNEDLYNYNPDIVEDEKVAEMNRIDAEKALKIKTPEQRRKKKIIIAIIIVAIVLVIVGLCVLKVMSQNKELNLKEVNVAEFVSKKQPPEDVVQGETDTVPVTLIQDGSGTADSPASVNEYIKTDVTVNVRKDTTSQYENYNTSYYTGLTGAVIGNDDVIALVDEYNKNGAKKINIDTSSYGEDIKLVAFEVNSVYPESYPTNLNDGVVNNIPSVSLSLIGTFVDKKKPDIDYSNSIVIGKSTYEILPATDIVDKPEEVNKADGYTYRCIIPMPIGANSDNYVIKVNINGKDIYYNGIEIK